jgi:broad specificity phosphatase PhoE
LTALVREQATDQGEILRRHVPYLYETDVVVSPLGRVIETVEIAFPGMAYRIDDDLMEHDVGPISGLTLPERIAVDPRFGSNKSDEVMAAYFSIKGGDLIQRSVRGSNAQWRALKSPRSFSPTGLLGSKCVRTL